MFIQNVNVRSASSFLLPVDKIFVPAEKAPIKEFAFYRN